ncbi:MAG: hypothetical protein GXO68_04560, partial [Crenarchaeota archaeon]|nr:hypothetical protein [Thermoproteota archaeon]
AKELGIELPTKEQLESIATSTISEALAKRIEEALKSGNYDELIKLGPLPLTLDINGKRVELRADVLGRFLEDVNEAIKELAKGETKALQILVQAKRLCPDLYSVLEPEIEKLRESAAYLLLAKAIDSLPNTEECIALAKRAEELYPGVRGLASVLIDVVRGAATPEEVLRVLS